jgi:DNA transposition AAA+ family ATPase
MTITQHAPAPGICQTKQVLAVRREVMSAARRKRLLALTGPSGAGKTTAAEDAVRRAAAELSLKPVEILTSRRPAPTEFTVRALEGLTGSAPKLKGFLLDDMLVAALTATPAILLLDESHRFGQPGLEQIQYICERVRTPVVFVGIADLGALIRRNSTLHSRTTIVDCESPADEGFRDVLAAIHPAFTTAARSQLRRLETHARRNLHDWKEASVLLEELAEQFELDPQFTPDLTTAVLQRLNRCG